MCKGVACTGQALCGSCVVVLRNRPHHVLVSLGTSDVRSARGTQQGLHHRLLTQAQAPDQATPSGLQHLRAKRASDAEEAASPALPDRAVKRQRVRAAPYSATCIYLPGWVSGG